MKLIIDTDPGHDDLVAIAVAHHVADISLVTTVSGNAPLHHTTVNALVAADLIGYRGPVVAGADRPREREAQFAPEIHGETGLGGAPRPQPTRAVTPGHAVDAILDTASSDTWMVAVGPLTNVAAAIERDPTLPHRIAGISIMGGAVATGNVSPVAEFNIWTDPEAAGIVFRSGARLVMCGLDLTTQVRYDESWVQSLDQPYVAALLAHYLANHRYREREGAPLHDPCAVLAVTHPQLFTFADHPVAVECGGTLTRGMTVVDRRPWAAGANVSLAVTVDAAAVLALVAETIRGMRQET